MWSLEQVQSRLSVYTPTCWDDVGYRFGLKDLFGSPIIYGMFTYIRVVEKGSMTESMLYIFHSHGMGRSVLSIPAKGSNVEGPAGKGGSIG